MKFETPDALFTREAVFSGNVEDIQFFDAGAADVTVSVAVNSETLFSFLVTPNDGKFSLKLSELLNSALAGYELQAGLDSVLTEVPLVTIKAGTDCELSCRVIRGTCPSSIALDKCSLLTFRPKKTLSYRDGCEPFTFYPGRHAGGSVFFQCRVYFASGNTADVVVPSTPLENPGAVVSLMSANCSYKVIRGLCDVAGLPDEIITGWSVRGKSTYTKTATDGTESTVEEYGDWHHFTLWEGNHQTYVFRNSVGTFDAIYTIGEKKVATDPDIVSFISDKQEGTVSVTALRSYEQNSGYLAGRETIGWWCDFFASAEQYVYEDGVLRKIVIEESDFETTEQSLSYFTFTWHYADRSYIPAPDRSGEAGEFRPSSIVYPFESQSGGDSSDGGVGSGDKTFYFVQAVPSTTWTIEHNLGKRPSVTVVDSAGTAVVGQVTYDTDDPLNKVTVTFSAEFSGTATLN